MFDVTNFYCRYPSDSTLLRSYRERCRWERYKVCMVQQTLQFTMSHHRRRPLVLETNAKEKQQKQEESRLISTLRMFRSKTMSEGMTKVPLALSTPLDLGDHENSHSKWLKQKDRDNQAILMIEPMLPGGRGRRKSIFVHNG